MQCLSVAFLLYLAPAGFLPAQESEPRTPDVGGFFERLDTNADGKVTLDEAPDQGRMLVEFLLRQAGKTNGDHLDHAEFTRVTARHSHQLAKHDTHDSAAAAALEAVLRHQPNSPASGHSGRTIDDHSPVATAPGSQQPIAALFGPLPGAVDAGRAPEDCPACAMGLTAEFVFKRLDVDEDNFVTVIEFMRSPGMQDMVKARDVVEKLDKSADGRLSWEELETAYLARHAECRKPDPATVPVGAEPVRSDGRGDGNRFAQVFILRSDQDGDGRISQDEFAGPAAGFSRLDKDNDGFIEANELGELHQRRLNDPKSMRERLESGDLPQPQQNRRPKGAGVPQ